MTISLCFRHDGRYECYFFANNEEDRKSKIYKDNRVYCLGYIRMDQTAGDFVRQAASSVSIYSEVQSVSIIGKIVWDILNHGPKGEADVTVRFLKLPYGIPREQLLKLNVHFRLKDSYFRHLNMAVQMLKPAALQKLVLEKDDFQSVIPTDLKYQFPKHFKLDSFSQRPAFCKIMSSSPRLPFLVTGPFGTGKTRLLASTAYYVLENMQASRVLIITHHKQTASDYVNKYFANNPNCNTANTIRLVRYKKAHSNKPDFEKSVEDIRLEPDQLKPCHLMITTFGTFLALLDETYSPHDLMLMLQPGYFSHILIDEGAQAREPETVAAFLLADTNTKIVIAGDNMQVSLKSFVQEVLLPNFRQ